MIRYVFAFSWRGFEECLLRVGIFWRLVVAFVRDVSGDSRCLASYWRMLAECLGSFGIHVVLVARCFAEWLGGFAMFGVLVPRVC